MDLIEMEAVVPDALPVAGLRAHLRLGHGFTDTLSDDALLAGFLRAAIARVEAQTGKALIRRRFELSLQAWRAVDGQPLPLAPVPVLEGLVLVARGGEEMPVASDRVRLLADLHRPRLVPVGATLPVIPWGGWARLRFLAGFGPVWGDVPADLAQAVLLLAARDYEDRDGSGGSGALPQVVAALCAPWRAMRIGGRA